MSRWLFEEQGRVHKPLHSRKAGVSTQAQPLMPPRLTLGTPWRASSSQGSAAAGPQAGASYIEAFLTVLKNVTKDETVQYVLALLEQTLAGQ